MTASISVVMGTYNGGAFVREQAQSLLAQAQPPAELVVADDGSIDGTLDVIRDTLAGAPFPVHLHRNAQNKGYRRNFIEAASLASAPLVAFCDQDDVWRPDKLARMTCTFDDPAVMLAYHNAAIIDGEGRTTGRLYGPDGGRKRSESSLADPWSFSQGFTQVFRRELVAFTPLQESSRDYLFPRERLAHDQWFFFLAECLGRVAFVDEDLVAYRQHADNVFGAVDRERARGLAVFKATLDHSRGQVAARGASLSAKAAVLDAIAADGRSPATTALRRLPWLAITRSSPRSTPTESAPIPAASGAGRRLGCAFWRRAGALGSAVSHILRGMPLGILLLECC